MKDLIRMLVDSRCRKVFSSDDPIDLRFHANFTIILEDNKLSRPQVPHCGVLFAQFVGQAKAMKSEEMFEIISQRTI